MIRKTQPALVIEQPVPMRKQVYTHLRDQILTNTIEATSRLVEAQIASELGISRTPVREALHLREKDGFIESSPRVGYRVKGLAWEELEEIFEIRRVNELLACRWAMRNMNAKTLKALESNLAKAKTAVSKEAPDLFLALDEEFHERLVQAAGSRHLMEICQQLRRLMLRYRTESIKTIETVKEAVAGHQRIVIALKEKNERALETAMLRHLDDSKENIRENALRNGVQPPADSAAASR